MSPAGERLPAAGSRPWTSAMTAAVKACPATFGLVPLNEASGVSHLFRFEMTSVASRIFTSANGSHVPRSLVKITRRHPFAYDGALTPSRRAECVTVPRLLA